MACRTIGIAFGLSRASGQGLESVVVAVVRGLALSPEPHLERHAG